MTDPAATVAGLPSQKGNTMNTTKTHVTPGHPTSAGAGYDCNCGECLHGRRSRRLEDTYSLGVLWNLDAATLNRDVEAGTTDPTPVSGDAHLRSRADLLVRTEDMNKAWAQARMESAATDHFADRRRDEARTRYRNAVAAARTAE